MLVFLDRVKENTSTTGSGTLTLTGAVAGFQAFSGIGHGNSTYYCIQSNDNQWETGQGVYNSGTLSRDTIFESSSGNQKINLNTSSTVFITYPASRAIMGDVGPTNNAILIASGTDGVNIRYGGGTLSPTGVMNLEGSLTAVALISSSPNGSGHIHIEHDNTDGNIRNDHGHLHVRASGGLRLCGNLIHIRDYSDTAYTGIFVQSIRDGTINESFGAGAGFNGVKFRNQYGVGWTDVNGIGNPSDLFIKRKDSGVLEINNGTSGQYASIYCKSGIFSDNNNYIYVGFDGTNGKIGTSSGNVVIQNVTINGSNISTTGRYLAGNNTPSSPAYSFTNLNTAGLSVSGNTLVVSNPSDNISFVTNSGVKQVSDFLHGSLTHSGYFLVTATSGGSLNSVTNHRASLSDTNVLTLPSNPNTASVLVISPNGTSTISQIAAIGIVSTNAVTIQHGISDALVVRNGSTAVTGKILLTNSQNTIAVGLFGYPGYLEINNGTQYGYRSIHAASGRFYDSGNLQYINIGHTGDYGCINSSGILLAKSGEKIGLFGNTPVIQPSGRGETTGFTTSSGTTVDHLATFTGGVGSTAYNISDIVKALKQIGVLRQ